MTVSRLQKLKSNYGKWITDEESGQGVFHVNNPHSLMQAAGYLKHIASGERRTAVFFRGQRRIYDGLKPTLYRKVSSQEAKGKLDARLISYLARIDDEKALRSVPEYGREPLLQHYGINTRWIDIVDNVWVALWFACHRAHANGRKGEFIHFERRTPNSENKEFAYILLVEIESIVGDSRYPGLYSGDHTTLIDLRVAIPSFFIRPHAQHALLFRRSQYKNKYDMECREFVSGVIRVNLVDALDWLGSGALVGVHVLFPPPAYDFGYRILLENAPAPDDKLGNIKYIGA